MTSEKPKTKKSKSPLGEKIIAIAGRWPKVEIGTHLTVTRYENGVTIMEWDDEALLEEVRIATLGTSSKGA